MTSNQAAAYVSGLGFFASEGWMRKWMKSQGLDSSGKRVIPKSIGDKVARAYVSQKITTAEAAKMATGLGFQCTQHWMHKYLSDRGVARTVAEANQVRCKGKRPHNAVRAEPDQARECRNLYKKGVSARELSRRMKLPMSAVIKILQTAGIKIRGHRESRINRGDCLDCLAPEVELTLCRRYETGELRRLIDVAQAAGWHGRDHWRIARKMMLRWGVEIRRDPRRLDRVDRMGERAAMKFDNRDLIEAHWPDLRQRVASSIRYRHRWLISKLGQRRAVDEALSHALIVSTRYDRSKGHDFAGWVARYAAEALNDEVKREIGEKIKNGVVSWSTPVSSPGDRRQAELGDFLGEEQPIDLDWEKTKSRLKVASRRAEKRRTVPKHTAAVVENLLIPNAEGARIEQQEVAKKIGIHASQVYQIINDPRFKLFAGDILKSVA